MEPTFSMTKLAQRLQKDMYAAIGQAVKEVDDENLSPEAAEGALLKAVQKRLAKTHAALLVVQVGTKRRRNEESDSKPKALRDWKPTRPALALEVARLLVDGVGLQEAPEEKRAGCELPLKIFSKQIATKLSSSTAGAEYTQHSINFAVTEVIGAVFVEAETRRAVESSDASFELHGSTDAAWRGTSARGNGIAMNSLGKEMILSAASQVAERLAQPAMQLPKVRA